jgi:hypothetical protein
MSIHKKVLRVTDEADKGTREYAETNKIGVYDAATLLLLRGLNQGAESSGPTQADFEAMKADRDRLQVEIEEADEARRVAELRAADPDPRPSVQPEPVPGVTDYATARGISYEEALPKLLDIGIRRQAALDTAAEKARGK